jgi:hypothetical protein
MAATQQQQETIAGNLRKPQQAFVFQMMHPAVSSFLGC